MHELPIMRAILATIDRNSELSEEKKLKSVTLKVGAARDIQEEWAQHYWTFITKGTYAEGSKIIIDVVPFTCKCKTCGEIFSFNLYAGKKPVCPKCNGSEAEIHTGKELEVDEVEVYYTKKRRKE